MQYCICVAVMKPIRNGNEKSQQSPLVIADQRGQGCLREKKGKAFWEPTGSQHPGECKSGADLLNMEKDEREMVCLLQSYYNNYPTMKKE